MGVEASCLLVVEVGVAESDGNWLLPLPGARKLGTYRAPWAKISRQDQPVTGGNGQRIYAKDPSTGLGVLGLGLPAAGRVVMLERRERMWFAWREEGR